MPSHYVRSSLADIRYFLARGEPPQSLLLCDISSDPKGKFLKQSFEILDLLPEQVHALTHPVSTEELVELVHLFGSDLLNFGLIGFQFDESVLREIKSQCPNLQGLHLQAGELDSCHLPFLPSGLRYLNLSNNYFDDDGAELITTKLPELRSLLLSGNFLSDTGAETIATNLTALTHLDLGKNNLTDAGALYIATNLTALTHLWLGANNLTDTGAEHIATNLKNLTTLWLDNSSLTDTGAHHIATNLTALSYAGLGNNNLTDTGAHDIATNLKNLTELHLGWNNLTDTSAEHIATNLKNLTTLGLNENNLTDAGAHHVATSLASLTHLWLEDNNLTDAGAGHIGTNLKHLTSLDLGKNNLTDTSARHLATNLKQLTHLWLDGNNLTDVGVEYIATNLKNLTTLWLSGNDLTDTSAHHIATNLKNLTRLALEGCKASVEYIATNLPHLGALWLAGNNLTDTDALTISTNLKHLTNLDLGDNHLTDAGARHIATNLKHLKYLGLSENSLTDIGAEHIAANLTTLTHLWLQANNLTDTGARHLVTNLKHLKYIQLDDNNLTDAGTLHITTHVKHLKELHLKNNQLRYLPLELGAISSLNKLSVEGNPWSPDFRAVVNSQGADELLTWLRRHHIDATRFEQAKVLVVGEGAVGKTSLVAQLCREGFVERPSSHGIELATQTETIDEQTYQLHYWDFGGQAVYRITHPFFFTPDTIYLVVWHARDGTSRGDTEDWLERIRLRVGDNARVLLVATNSADQNPTPDIEYLERASGVKIQGFFAVDNSTGDGIDQLRHSILEHIVDLGDADQKWPAAYQGLAEALDQSDDPELSWEEFLRVGADHDLDEGDCERAASKLSAAGRLTYFKDPVLQGKVILQPDWLTVAISYILNHGPTRTKNGVISKAQLQEVWTNPTARQGEESTPIKYRRTEVPFLLELMRLYGVAFCPDGPDADQFIIPQMVPTERPHDLGIPPTALAYKPRRIRCELHSRASRLGLIAGLTARNHAYTTGTWWRNGLVLHNKNLDSWALFERNTNETIELTVWGERSASFFSTLRSSLEARLDEWPGLKPTFRVLCPNTSEDRKLCTGSWSHRKLRKELERYGDRDNICDTCEDDVRTNQLLVDVPVETISEEQDLVLAKLEELLDSQKETRKSEKASRSRQLDLLHLMENMQTDHRTFFSAILQSLDADVRDIPRLVSINPADWSSADPRSWLAEKMELQFWCEHIEGCHPYGPKYEFKAKRDWFRSCAPYLQIVAGALRLTPVARQAMGAAEAFSNAGIEPLSFDEKEMAAIRSSIEATEAIVDLVIDDSTYTASSLEGRLDVREHVSTRTLRALRELIYDIGAHPELGGLERTKVSPTTQSSEVAKSSITTDGLPRWICPEHRHFY